jgi:hypothetical protein
VGDGGSHRLICSRRRGRAWRRSDADFALLCTEPWFSMEAGGRRICLASMQWSFMTRETPLQRLRRLTHRTASPDQWALCQPESRIVVSRASSFSTLHSIVPLYVFCPFLRIHRLRQKPFCIISNCLRKNALPFLERMKSLSRSINPEKQENVETRYHNSMVITH